MIPARLHPTFPPRRPGLRCIAAISAVLLGAVGGPDVRGSAAGTSEDAAAPKLTQADSLLRVGYGLAMSAKALCSAVFVSGRDVEDFIARDLRTDPAFDWWNDVEFEVDHEDRRVTLWRPGSASRTALFNGDQGCTILPEGAADVFFEPVTLSRGTATDRAREWPYGDTVRDAPLPDGVDAELLGSAIAFAFDDSTPAPQNTRALVVVHRGRLIAEGYAPGFEASSRLVGWSMGKSLVSAFIGVMVERGELVLNDPAPIVVWRATGDPRGAITMRHLLQMSSGLDFRRQSPTLKTPDNDHFYVYYGAIDVAAYSIARPLREAPGRRWAYRNGDPLALVRIVRERVELQGGNHLAWAQDALFNRIDARDFVLEPDPWGNLILTGFDYGTARDWARFGLLHLHDGMWRDARILPEGWVDFVRTPAPADSTEGYGGLFWLNRGGALPSVPRDAFMAAGHLGQRTLIVPSADLVIVRLGHSPDSNAFQSWFDQLAGRLVRAVASGAGATAER